MKETSELTLENIWSIPTLNITFLEDGIIYAELKNKSGKVIEIENLSCKFETEEGLESYVVSSKQKVSIKPNGLSRVQVSFIADLSLRKDTNTYRISVSYRYAGSSKLFSVSFDYSTKYVIINPIRPVQKWFFVSHKDPDNTELGVRLDYYLRKIGFEGYLAEKDNKPGLDMWKDKIIPKINGCTALIVLWTQEAQKDPTKIFREIRKARKEGKIVAPLLGPKTTVPDLLKGTREYRRVKKKITDVDLIEFVKKIEFIYTNGGYG